MLKRKVEIQIAIRYIIYAALIAVLAGLRLGGVL